VSPGARSSFDDAAVRESLTAAGLTPTMVSDLLKLCSKMKPGLVEVAGSTDHVRELQPLLKAAGVGQLGLRQKATIALRSLATRESLLPAKPKEDAGGATADKEAATKEPATAEAKASVTSDPDMEMKAVKIENGAVGAQNVLRSVKAALVPGSLTCYSCRVTLPEDKFSQDQLARSTKRRCEACDFTARVNGGTRFTAAVAAAVVIQAKAKGRLVRHGYSVTRSTEDPASHKPEDTSSAGDTLPATAAPAAPPEGTSAPPSEKELSQATAVALYDQMATIGIAPPFLKPLRKALPVLIGIAYDGDTDGLLAALKSGGITDLKLLQQCAMAVMELAGAAKE